MNMNYYLYPKKKNPDVQIAISEKTHRFLMFLRKIKDKKLKKSYQMNINYYLYPKDYDPSVGTFSFNRYIFVQ